MFGELKKKKKKKEKKKKKKGGDEPVRWIKTGSFKSVDSI